MSVNQATAEVFYMAFKALKSKEREDFLRKLWVTKKQGKTLLI